MIHFEGDRNFTLKPSELWAKLTDARFLVQCVPGVESVKTAEAATAVWTLRPGFSFVRGTLEVTLRVTDAVAAQSARLLLHSKGIGSTSEVEATLNVAPREDGASVHWTADVKSLGGLLKAVPQGLIQASAQKVIADVWAGVDAKVAAP